MTSTSIEWINKLRLILTVNHYRVVKMSRLLSHTIIIANENILNDGVQIYLYNIYYIYLHTYANIYTHIYIYIYKKLKILFQNNDSIYKRGHDFRRRKQSFCDIGHILSTLAVAAFCCISCCTLC